MPELGRQGEEQSGAQLGLLLPQGARPQHTALVGREGQVRDRGQATDLPPGQVGGRRFSVSHLLQSTQLQTSPSFSHILVFQCVLFEAMIIEALLFESHLKESPFSISAFR